MAGIVTLNQDRLGGLTSSGTSSHRQGGYLLDSGGYSHYHICDKGHERGGHGGGSRRKDNNHSGNRGACRGQSYSPNPTHIQYGKQQLCGNQFHRDGGRLSWLVGTVVRLGEDGK